MSTVSATKRERRGLTMLSSRHSRLRVNTTKRLRSAAFSRKRRVGFLGRGDGARSRNVRIRESIRHTRSGCFGIVNLGSRIRRNSRSRPTRCETAMFGSPRPQGRHRLTPARVPRSPIYIHIGRNATFPLQIGYNRGLRCVGAVVRRRGVDSQRADPLVHTAVNAAAPRFTHFNHAPSLRSCIVILVDGG